MLIVVQAAMITKMEELDLPDVIKITASRAIETKEHIIGISVPVSKKYPKIIPMIRKRESLTEFCLKNTGGFYKSTVPIFFP